MSRRYCVLGLGAVLFFSATTPNATACSHSYDFYLDAWPSNYDFGSSAPGPMAEAIAEKMQVPISIVSTPFPDENTEYQPMLGNTGTPPNFNYGPGPMGTIYNLNLQRPIVTGILRGELRLSGSDVESDGNSYERYVLRVFTATVFYDVLVRINFFTYQPDIGGVCGFTSAGWDFYEISGPRLIPGPTLTAAVSRKTHDSVGTFDVNLPLSGTRGVECRSGGANGAYTVVFTFSENLTGVDGRVVTPCGTVSSANIGPNANQYTVNLTGVCNAQYVTVTLTGVHGTAGGTTPSTSATMGVLLGDVNADGFVLSGDYTATRQRSGSTVDASNFRYDINADGFILSGDYTTVRQQSGTQLPMAP